MHWFCTILSSVDRVFQMLVVMAIVKVRGRGGVVKTRKDEGIKGRFWNVGVTEKNLHAQRWAFVVTESPLTRDVTADEGISGCVRCPGRVENQLARRRVP
jgi:hypothetical protein